MEGKFWLPWAIWRNGSIIYEVGALGEEMKHLAPGTWGVSGGTVGCTVGDSGGSESEPWFWAPWTQSHRVRRQRGVLEL